MSQENQAALESAERQIEISIEQAKEMVDKKNMIDKIIQTKEFNEIFTVGYMEKEAARLVSLLADQEWQDELKQKSLFDDMRAISGLRQYIVNIRALGRQMERQIESSEAQLDEMRIESEEV